MKINIRGGTRSSTQRTLCEGCAHATIVQGAGQNDRLVKCGGTGEILLFTVETCSAYRAFGTPTLYEMKEMATVIEVRQHGVGFYTAEQWREKRGEAPILPKEYEND